MRLLKQLMLAGCLFASAKQDTSIKFFEIVDQFYKVNPKIRSVAIRISASSAKAGAEILKTINVKIAKRKDLQKQAKPFSNPVLMVGIKASVSTLFDIQAENAKKEEEYYASKGGSVAEVEKITVEYLQMISNLNMKREMLLITNEYLAARRKDVKEADARAKYGDISNEEQAEFKSHAADAEYSYSKIVNEIKSLESQIKFYYPSYELNADNNSLKIPSISLEDFESMVNLEDKASDYESLSQKQAKCAVSQARGKLLSGVTSIPLPEFEFGFETYLRKEKADPSEQDKMSLTMSWNLSPYKFLDLYKSQAEYESAKYDYGWEEQKYSYEFSKLVNEIKIAKSSFASASKLLQAKKTALDSAKSQYASGNISHSKLGDFRSSYYSAVERYYGAKEKYVNALLEHMKLTGKIRNLFTQSLAKESGN